MIIKGITSMFVRIIVDCPQCGTRHIDKPDTSKNWTNPPHKTHQCQSCGHLWRPFDYPTMGVNNLNDDVEVIQ